MESLKKQKINAVFLETFDEITDYLLRETQKGDVILVMGAGDINALTPLLIKKLKNLSTPYLRRLLRVAVNQEVLVVACICLRRTNLFSFL